MLRVLPIAAARGTTFLTQRLEPALTRAVVYRGDSGHALNFFGIMKLPAKRCTILYSKRVDDMTNEGINQGYVNGKTQMVLEGIHGLQKTAEELNKFVSNFNYTEKNSTEVLDFHQTIYDAKIQLDRIRRNFEKAR